MHRITLVIKAWMNCVLLDAKWQCKEKNCYLDVIWCELALNFEESGRLMWYGLMFSFTFLPFVRTHFSIINWRNFLITAERKRKTNKNEQQSTWRWKLWIQNTHTIIWFHWKLSLNSLSTHCYRFFPSISSIWNKITFVYRAFFPSFISPLLQLFEYI